MDGSNSFPPQSPHSRELLKHQGPLYRFFEGEVNFRLKLLPAGRLDLEEKEVRVHAAMVITKRGRIVKQPVL